MHDWQHYAEEITQQVVRIETQCGWGTGFVYYSRLGGTHCIATAYHVIKKQQSFRLWHGTSAFDFGKDVAAKDAKKIYFVQHKEAYSDSAVLIVLDPNLPSPRVSLASSQERQEVRIGMEVGWLGFPALEGVTGQLCFFSGRISYVDELSNYFLIDGNVVQGCSGGPVFCVTTQGVRIIGALSGFIPNRNSPEGGYLPGLGAAFDISIYKQLEVPLDKIRTYPVQQSLQINLKECPKCGGNLTEQRDTNGQPDIVCQSGCGALTDLLNQDFVRGAPGGAADLKKFLVEQYRSVVGN